MERETVVVRSVALAGVAALVIGFCAGRWSVSAPKVVGLTGVARPAMPSPFYPPQESQIIGTVTTRRDGLKIIHFREFNPNDFGDWRTPDWDRRLFGVDPEPTPEEPTPDQPSNETDGFEVIPQRKAG